MKLKISEDFKFNDTDGLCSTQLEMPYAIIKDGIIYNSTKEEASYILTRYKNFEAMKEGFITLKMARRFKLKTIKFKIIRGINPDTNFYILLGFEKDIIKVNVSDTKVYSIKQKEIYDQISDKETFFKQLVFNFFIYNVNFSGEDIHYYKGTNKLGPLLDISIYDRNDKEPGYLFNILVYSIIKPAQQYFDNDFIKETINTFAKRINKMLNNKRMELFYGAEVLQKIIRYNIVQLKRANSYFKVKNETR